MKVNNRGFSLFEIMIALGLSSFLMLAVADVYRSMKKGQESLQTYVMDQTNLSLADRVISADLRNSDPSFNNLLFLDDNRKVFYQYFSDVPPKATLTNGVSRQLTLNKDTIANRKSFYVLLRDEDLGATLNYDPVAAYSYTRGNLPIDQSVPLIFRGLNYNNWVSTQRPNMWATNKILLLDTPTAVRDPRNLTPLGMVTFPPRSTIFLGYVSGANLLNLSSMIKDNGANLVDQTSALDNNVTVNSADMFLRSAPPVGGGQILVRLSGAKVVRYILEQGDRYGYQLARYEYVPGREWANRSLVADRLESVTFKRDSVLTNMVNYQITKREIK